MREQCFWFLLPERGSKFEKFVIYLFTIQMRAKL